MPVIHLFKWYSVQGDLIHLIFFHENENSFKMTYMHTCCLIKLGILDLNIKAYSKLKSGFFLNYGESHKPLKVLHPLDVC